MTETDMNNYMEYSKKRYLYFLLSCSFISSPVIAENWQKQVALAAVVGAVIGIMVVESGRNKIEFDLMHKKTNLLELELAVTQKKHDDTLTRYEIAKLKQPERLHVYELERLKLENEAFRLRSQMSADTEKRLQEFIDCYSIALNKCEDMYGKNTAECEQNRRLVALSKKALGQTLQKQYLPITN